MVIYDYTSSPVSSQEDARSLVKELRCGGAGTHLFAKSTTRMTTSDRPRRRSRSVQRTVPDAQPRSRSKSRTRTPTARDGANNHKETTGQQDDDDDDDDDDEPLLYQEAHDEEEPEWELEDDDDEDSCNDSDNEAACLAAARRSLSGDLLGMATAALPTTTTTNTTMPYVDLELVESATLVSNLSMDMTNTLHSTSPGTTPLPSSSSESDRDDEPNQHYNDKVMHNLLCQGEWDLLEDHLGQLYGTPSLLRRALLHRNDAQETVLQVLCCQAPPPVAVRCLEALDRLNLAESILTTAVDAAENTILHTVCAHVRSRRRRTPKTTMTSSSTTTKSSSVSSSRRSRSRPPSRRHHHPPRDKSRGRPKSQSPARGDKRSSSCESPRKHGGAKSQSRRHGRSNSRPPSSSSKRPEKSTPTGTTKSSSKSSSKSSKAKRRHSHSHGGVTMPALIPIDESESSHPSEAAGSIHEVPSTTTTTTTPHSFSVLEFSILQQLVVLAPHLLERTNHFGDTPLHLLVASPGLSKAKYKHRSTETCMAAELAAHDVVGQCLHRVPRSVAVHANRRGLTLLHGAIARGAHELVLVQLLQHLRHAAALPDVRGWYPLHYVAVHPNLIPWTFCHDLIAAYPQALVAQSYDTGDAPLHLLLARISKSIRTHDKKKKKKKKNKEPKKTRRSMGHSSSSGSNQPKYYLDRNTAKLAELLSKSTSEWQSGSSNAREGSKRSSRSTRVRIDSSTNSNSSSNSSSPTVPTCALLLQNYQHWSPLHYCAKLGAAAERLVHVWRKKSPQGMHQASVLSTQTERVTPLHMACAQKPCSHDMVQALALCGPHACAAQDFQGRTPLAVAICNSSVSSSMVQSLIDVYPQAVELASHGNYLPLHLALQQERSETICHSLIRAAGSRKKSLEAATVAGDTPFHMACAQSQSSVRVVKLLAERFPEAIFLRNTAGQSPFDLARIFNPTLLKAIPQLETARQDLLLHNSNNNKNDPDESTSPTPQLSPKTAAVEGTKRRKSISGILRRTD